MPTTCSAARMPPSAAPVVYPAASTSRPTRSSVRPHLRPPVDDRRPLAASSLTCRPVACEVVGFWEMPNSVSALVLCACQVYKFVRRCSEFNMLGSAKQRPESLTRMYCRWL